MNLPAVKRRVESLAGRRTVKQQWQVRKIRLELVVTALRMWRFSCVIFAVMNLKIDGILKT